VVEASDYQAVLDELAANKGATTLNAAAAVLAAKAYARTAAYDAAILELVLRFSSRNDAPDYRAFGGRLIQSLRLRRKNPHQTAGLLCHAGQNGPGVATARQLQGKRTVLQQHQRHRWPPMNASAEFDAKAPPPPASSSSMPTPAAFAEGADPRRGLSQGARLPIFLKRRPMAVSSRAQPHARTPKARTPPIIGIFTEVIIGARCEPKEAIAIIARPPGNLRLLLAGALPDPRHRGPGPPRP